MRSALTARVQRAKAISMSFGDSAYERGRQFFLAGFFFLCVSFLRWTIGVFGFANAVYISGRFFSSIGAVLVLIGSILILRSRYYRENVHRSRLWKLYILFAYPVWLFIYGYYIRQNEILTISATETFSLFIIPCWLTVGALDDMWRYLRMPMILMFYLTCFLMVCSYRIEDPFKDLVLGSDIMAGERYTGSLAYRLHPLLTWGMFLLVVGMEKRGNKPLLQQLACFAVVPYIIFEVVLFKFRSAAIGVPIALGGVVVSQILNGKKIATGRWLLLGFIGLAFLALSVYSPEMMAFEARWQEKNEVGYSETIKEERWRETEIMLEQSSVNEWLFGRGAGGSFDASELYGDMGCFWMGAHIGVSGLFLKGGGPYVILILWTLLYGKRHRRCVISPYQSSAVAFLPFIIYYFLLSPMGFVAEQMLCFLGIFLCLGRHFALPQQQPYVRQKVKLNPRGQLK